MRLSSAALGRLPAAVGRPPYDRGGVTPGIVHLGIGAFHRAHQAVYTDDALAAGETGWGIVGASLRSAETRDALAPQDGLYTLAVRGAEGERLRVIGSVLEVRVAAEDPSSLLARLAHPGTRIVSLTVTEKGYCQDPATGALDEAHPGIRSDLAGEAPPRTAPGILVEALRLRRRAGLAPFSVLCCDNLPANGETVRRIVGRFAALRDSHLGAFVGDAVAFPSTMVDRIVPATTAADRAAVAARLGLDDAWPVVTEPFSQWVIEDRFTLGRPAWDAAGALFVRDVRPFERMKLRLLNGAHSALAYLALPAGIASVAEAVALPGMEPYLRALWAEAGATLDMPPGTDLRAYGDALVRRFRNPALRHRTAQIAMDGSQKLPVRLLPSIRDRLRAGRDIDALALGVAAWMRCVLGRAEDGARLDIADPMGPRLAALAAAPGEVEARARRLLALREIFGDELPAEPRFTAPVIAALGLLLDRGTRAVLARYAAGGDRPAG